MPKRGWSTKAFFLFQVLPPITFDTVMSGGGVLMVMMCWYGELVVTMMQNVTDLTDI